MARATSPTVVALGILGIGAAYIGCVSFAVWFVLWVAAHRAPEPECEDQVTTVDTTVYGDTHTRCPSPTFLAAWTRSGSRIVVECRCPAELLSSTGVTLTVDVEDVEDIDAEEAP